MKKKKQKQVKRSNKIIKVILIILLCAGIGIVAYFGTLELDKLRKGGDVDVIVTFDDNEFYTIPSVKKMDKEQALEEWPYIFTIENNGTRKALYQIKFDETENATIKRDDLAYALYLDNQEIEEGHLKDIKENVLYTSEIKGMEKQQYKLYIWSSEEQEGTYEYKLSFNMIKDGGPGF